MLKLELFMQKFIALPQLQDSYRGRMYLEQPFDTDIFQPQIIRIQFLMEDAIEMRKAIMRLRIENSK